MSKRKAQKDQEFSGGIAKMEPVTILKQMMDVQKAAFNNGYNGMEMVREQSEKMLSMSLEQAAWLPEEGKRVIDEWAKAYQKGCEAFKKTVDANFTKLETFFSENNKSTKTKAK